MTEENKSRIIDLENLVIKFAGDSGDGMQFTGNQFSKTSAIDGKDIATFPDFPAEIRGPAGTVSGVSGFQVHVGQKGVYSSGDLSDVLLALNPASLRLNLSSTKKDSIIIIDSDKFTDKNIEKAGFKVNPFKDNTFVGHKVISAPITTLTKEALKDTNLKPKTMLLSRNMFALGIIFWLFNEQLDNTYKILEQKFSKKPEIIDANKKVLKAGFNYPAVSGEFDYSFRIGKACKEKGSYRNITGNVATAWGVLAAAENANLKVFLGSYPITPATEILQELSKHKQFGARVFQAEDEIAGVVSAIGASFGGALPITTTSGPGLALKSEAIGLAVITELPLVVVNVQRGGPSTGLPTKPEQSDLMQALYGRNGESPAIVIAASSPADCFYYSYMASKYSLEHMTPVILLTDGYLANGSGLFKIPKLKELPSINPRFVKDNTEDYQPYRRDEETLARDWAIPGQEGVLHRVGGLEKANIFGSVSHDPDNHQLMSEIREAKVRKLANFIPEQEILGNKEGKLLVVGWGGTYGALREAVDCLRYKGKNISLAQFNYIKPLPKNTRDIFSKFENIIVCENNLGQFINYLRGELPEFKYDQHNQMKGKPLVVSDLVQTFNNYFK